MALVRRCSFSDQQIQRCRLEEVPDRLTPYSKFAPPVLAIVGEIVDQESGIDWFVRRPLLANTDSGHAARASTIVDVRSAGRPRRLRAASAGHYHSACRRPGGAADSRARGHQYDWIVFSSANGVRFFLDAMFAAGHDARHLGNCRLAAIGAVTAAALRRTDSAPMRYPTRFALRTWRTASAPRSLGKRCCWSAPVAVAKCWPRRLRRSPNACSRLSRMKV